MEQITGKMSSYIDGDQTRTLESITLPPGKPGKPYLISTQDGEIFYIPLSKSATRLLVTGKETDNAFAVVGSGGSQSDPIGFHFHKETHDVFLCQKGSINVWAGEKCRTMEAGDFASVPPGTIHQYQILGAHSEFMGLIVPGGWVEFFRVIGDPYSGPLWPMQDDRDFFQHMLPRLKTASEQYDMIPCPQHKQFGPQEWEADENKLPSKHEPFFLRNASGPAYEVGGSVLRPLITTAESNGKFSIGSVEGSSQFHQDSIFAKPGRSIRFDNVHHAFQITEGSIEFHLDSTAPSKLSAGELIYVPKGTAFRFQVTSRFAKMYAFTSGKGLVEVLRQLGKNHESTILPEKANHFDAASLEALQPEFGFSVW